jgi:hypothetical protein
LDPFLWLIFILQQIFEIQIVLLIHQVHSRLLIYQTNINDCFLKLKIKYR